MWQRLCTGAHSTALSQAGLRLTSRLRWLLLVFPDRRKLEEDMSLLQMQLQQRESELMKLQQQVGCGVAVAAGSVPAV